MEEKTKTCPFCRAEISTLARKCRYCGEMVGDPLQTELKLTVDDIGRPEESRVVSGETLVTAYQALQAELKQKTEKIHKETKRSLITVLHAKEILLTALVIAAVAGLVALGFWIVRFVGQQRENLEHARVVSILKEANEFKMSGNPIEALRTARKALEEYPESDTVHSMLRDLRARIKDDMEDLYRRRLYDNVIAYGEQALAVEPENAEFMMLAKRAEQDRIRYSLQLAGIVEDQAGNRVAAIRTYQHGVVNVGAGDSFMQIRVLSIDEQNARVILFDDERGVRLRVGKEGCTFETSP